MVGELDDDAIGDWAVAARFRIRQGVLSQSKTSFRSARVFFSGQTSSWGLGLSAWQAYGDFILSHTPNYLQRRPRSYPPALAWPDPNTIVDSLAEMSRLNWP